MNVESSPTQNDHSSSGNAHILWVGILLEGSLIFLAVGLSFFGIFDPSQPLRDFSWNQLSSGLVWGVVASVPMFAYLALFHFFSATWIRSLRKFCVEHLKPLFVGSTLFELAIISLLAGLGEELLFRWSIQGGLAALLEPQFDSTFAIWLALLAASFLFGLCHAVTFAYFAITFVIGIFLGWTMIVSGNWLVPAVAHALYDFVALIYIVRMADDREHSTP